MTRGAYSYLNADKATIEGRNTSDPFYRIFQLDVGAPLAGCVVRPPNQFVVPDIMIGDF